MFTVKILSEEYHRHSNTLKNWAEELTRDIKNSSKFQAQLVKRKLDLEQHLFQLNQQKNDIQTTCIEKRHSKVEVQNLLQSMAEYERNIFHVKCQIERCVKQLHFANCDYRSLSSTLNNCVNYLQLAKKRNEKLELVVRSCTKHYRVVFLCSLVYHIPGPYYMYSFSVWSQVYSWTYCTFNTCNDFCILFLEVFS